MVNVKTQICPKDNFSVILLCPQSSVSSVSTYELKSNYFLINVFKSVNYIKKMHVTLLNRKDFKP